MDFNTCYVKMLFSLLLLCLLFSPVLSMKCYVCNSSTTNEECNQGSQECQAPLDTCMTIVDKLGAMTAIVKQCASQATCKGAAASASVDANGNGNSITCCSGYDFCNFSGAESIHIHTTLLLLTASVLLLLSH
ncbi:prostate stem cell antigen-like [Mastacembelus armatus]|uniref:Prostate stem cell antigen-like n=1 Tax=Mastacembelus armatus TaxID=205130 RepID=A0A3Q3T3S2_9TELE|nr:prostate stem cell antigen-like [Mastacembelus armatus]